VSRVDVAVIVVGFNTVDYVRQCLSSLRSTAWGGYTFRLVYVDNASTDASAETVRHEFPDVEIVANRENVGFCRACNQAAALTASRYVYLLNNDTVVFPETIPALLRFLDAMPAAGVAGNRLLNPDLSDQWSARRFPSALNALFGRRTWLGRRFANGEAMRDYLYKDEMRRGEPFQVDWVPGSCSLVRREAYESIGGLPDDMHYWSDAVFCDRLAAAGWQTFVVPAAPLVHFEGQGTGVHSFDVRRWLIADFHRGAYRFYCEHYRLTRIHPARWVAWLGLDLRRRLLVAAARREFERS
jgi:GT2 family glycosyltransferase